jgi:aspartate kinase
MQPSPTVMKFGGTSVEDLDAFRRVAGIAGERRSARPVLVVSAMSRVTDGLLAVLRQASEGHVEAAGQGVDELIARHQAVAAGLAGPEGEEAGRSLERSQGELHELLRTIARLPGTRRALSDELVSYGERLSSALLAAVLREHDLPGAFVDARTCILTDGEHQRATPLLEATRRQTRAVLAPLLADGSIPVLGGFVGATPEGATTTLGRGGSDYSATLIGAALGAAEIQIWTDVCGFLTADPRVVPGAQPIAHLSYAEAAELAYFGAKVLHPKTIQPAVESEIPVRVCNSRAPSEPSTRIDGRREPSPQGVKAIAHKCGITIVQVTSARMLGAHGFLSALFEVFARHRVAVDIVATSEVSVSLTVDDALRLGPVVDDLRALGTVEVTEGFAIVCAVGQGLRGTPGILARVFGTLAELDIALVSQGASSINLTFAVSERAVEKAVQRLHAAFFERGG